MTVKLITSHLMAMHECIVYLNLKGVSENLVLIDGIIQAISDLENLLSKSTVNFARMKAVFSQAKTDKCLPSDIMGMFHSWAGEITEDFIAGSQMSFTAVKTQKKCDADFKEILQSIDSMTTTQLLEQAIENIEKHRVNKENYDSLCHWHKIYFSIDSFSMNDSNFVRYFTNVYAYLKENLAALNTFYGKLCDYRSKYSLMLVIKYLLSFTPDFRMNGVEHTYKHYFDLDLISCDSDEVFVDCGAYVGDTVIDFIDAYGSEYKRIYAYELTQKTFKDLEQNTKDYKNIVLRNVGVSDKEGIISMLEIPGSEFANRLYRGGAIKTPVVSLDNDIKEKITFIKMDIEGGELDALRGAQNHIRTNRPKLAVSLYHSLPELLDIPALIHEINPNYKFYFRHCGGMVNYAPFPTEYILIAI